MSTSTLLNRYRPSRRFVFVSYPKSGRTWMRYVFSLARCQVRFTHAGHGTAKLSEIGTAFSGLRTDLLGRRNIFMHRNPLDTAVSLYFQIHKRDFSPTSLDYAEKYEKLSSLGCLPPRDIAHFVIDPVWGVENICRYNSEWLEFFDGRKNSFLLRYEDAVSNPELAIGRILEFVDLKSVDARELAKASSFQSMREIELSGAPAGWRLRGDRPDDHESLKMRKGVVRGYSEYLDPKTIEAARNIAARFQLEI